MVRKARLLTSAACSAAGDVQYLAGIDQVGIADLVAVALVELRPFAPVVVNDAVSGDLTEVIALYNCVGAGHGNGDHYGVTA